MTMPQIVPSVVAHLLDPLLFVPLLVIAFGFYRAGLRGVYLSGLLLIALGLGIAKVEWQQQPIAPPSASLGYFETKFRAWPLIERTPYESDLLWFVRTRSQEDVDWMKRQVDKRREDCAPLVWPEMASLTGNCYRHSVITGLSAAMIWAVVLIILILLTNSRNRISGL